jgi:serine/threonine protein kinase
MASALAEPRLAVIGDYEILSLLGCGAMSQVYKGRCRNTGEFVAVKVPLAALLQNPILLKRFAQEFGVARLLDHPNLVRVLKYGHSDGTPYIAMEYIDGVSLGDRIDRDGPLSEAEALGVITQVGTVLHAAHKRKIIHRDVKPDNILLTTDGRAKLTDLGLAKDVEADLDLTRPMRGLGTPFYIAPEQFTDAKHVDGRCDVYSLAATLYMAVTGEAPFQARGNLSIWKKKMANDLTPPRQRAPGLSERVERAICRALSADPDARPATCRRFIRELRSTPRPRPALEAAPPVAPSAGRSQVGDRRTEVRFPSRLKGFCRPLAAEKRRRWPVRVRNVCSDGVAMVMGRRFEPGAVLRVTLPGETGSRVYLVRVVGLQVHALKTWVVDCVFPRPISVEEVKSLR